MNNVYIILIDFNDSTTYHILVKKDSTIYNIKAELYELYGIECNYKLYYNNIYPIELNDMDKISELKDNSYLIISKT